MGDFSVILVPQGAEYRAVCRGLSRGLDRASLRPIVQAIPVGVQPVRDFLSQALNPMQQSECFSPDASVLVLGLCGSLTPTLAVGDIVLYRQCLSQADPGFVLPLAIDFPTGTLARETLHPVTGLTSDRILWAASEKQQLGQAHSADVVDMEGTAILEVLGHSKLPVTMLRVVSDDCHHDLPDLSQAVSPAGQLLPRRLAIAMLQKPIAATRLIRGSLQGLKVLEKVVSELFHSE